MRTRRKNKYYLVVSKDKGYTYGAFPYTDQGLEDAKAYVKKSKKNQKEELLIEERS